MFYFLVLLYLQNSEKKNRRSSKHVLKKVYLKKSKYQRGPKTKVTTFSGKWFFIIIKQNGINKNFQKFTCKPQSAYYISLFTCLISLTPRHDLIIQNFATS